MIYTERVGDLFDVERKYYFVHCISSDFALGMGIAKEFDRRFNLRSKLCATYPVNGFFPTCLLVDNVFNLVTKQLYWHKPTYATINRCLLDLRTQVELLDVHYLAMPQIGCGLDKLSWQVVSNSIREIFSDLDIEILIVTKPIPHSSRPTTNGSKPPYGSCKPNDLYNFYSNMRK